MTLASYLIIPRNAKVGSCHGWRWVVCVCLAYNIPIYDAKRNLKNGATSTGFNFLAQREC
jgi:hypothetical protein